MPKEIIRLILSFLRNKPKSVCMHCGCVCIWDKQVKEFFWTSNLYYNISHPSSNDFYVQNIYCIDCELSHN
jgi:hypothetical protein